MIRFSQVTNNLFTPDNMKYVEINKFSVRNSTRIFPFMRSYLHRKKQRGEMNV